MQPIDMTMIYYWDKRNGSYLEHVLKKCILWASDNKSMFSFLIDIISVSRTCDVFFEFLVSVINHYHSNGLHLFWDSREWFCLQISCDAKYFSCFVYDIVTKDW